MGYGDALLAAGLAESIYAEDPSLGPVVICNGVGKARWHPLWEGNPAVCCPQPSPPETQRRITFGSGHLPYYPYTPETTWRSRDHRPTLYLTDVERARGAAIAAQHGPFVLIEPPGKDRKNLNRNWPAPQWRLLVDRLKGRIPYALLQLDREAADRIDGIPGLPHASFRDACAILSAARLLVTTEGGLLVGAAALKVPAVALWGGCGSAEVGGYPDHVNLVDSDPQTPCGSQKPCAHCAAAWVRLTVDTVADAVRGALGGA